MQQITLSARKWLPGMMLLLLMLAILQPVQGQRKKGKSTASTQSFDESLYDGLNWRHIGPYRGGRSAAVTGVPGKPLLYYMGATGGGVWRTTDGGNSWHNISDGYFGGSIGAIAVSEYDNNVIYVGGGEVTVRGNMSYGYGMWKSVDAGETWEQIGLKDSRHIVRIRIHPKNPDLVYAAVLGNVFDKSSERGVYRSKDGGKNWERILYANDQAGAVDLVLDPANPRHLYASTWYVKRTPYSLISGGEGSALWKSTDGGDTWKELSKNPGFPKGTLGIIGMAVSPVNNKRVWAQVEADEGGLFRSDDGGATWKMTNNDRALRQRAWYYTRVYADPQDVNGVYVLNVRYHHSTDGGVKFAAANAPHGDHHDLWIAPEDPNRMIMGDDGGAQVSYDQGTNWTTYHNQPTAQFYRVITDDAFPYRIYGAQQDNSTIRIAHRSDDWAITEQDWESTAGGESAHIAVDPDDNDIVYGGSYGGFLTRLNHKTGEIRAINVWPDNPMGHGAEDMKYRFQWNFPIFYSPHNSDKLYAASNHLHITTNEGQSWEVISPDLTRNDPSTLGPSGGPITKDNTGVEYYGTIFAAMESPYEEGLIWTASDDGLVHITRDAGKNWKDVTPADAPKWIMWNSVEADPFVKGGVYLAGTQYKSGDFRPYLYKSKDYGQTWTKIVSGIDNAHFTRVVRADPKRKGLLYAGTETGMYISFDDGASWKAFQLNLPMVPITDLAIKNDNLIAATQGRSFWLIDDLTPLHQLSDEVAKAKSWLYQPLPSYRMGGGGGWGGPPPNSGTNHPGGVMVHFLINEEPDSGTVVKMEFLEKDGEVIQTYSSDAKKPQEKLAFKKGMNRFVWNMRYPGAEGFEGMILWWAGLNGPKAVPGDYKVRLSVGEQSMEQDFQIRKDPRSQVTVAQIQQQFDYLQKIVAKVTETHETIESIRELRGQLNEWSGRIAGDTTQADLQEDIKELVKAITEIEETLYQTKNRSGQDPLNFPIRLNNKLAHLNSLMGMGDYPPTAQAEAFYKEVSAAIDEQLDAYDKIVAEQVPGINDRLKKAIDELILIETEKE